MVPLSCNDAAALEVYLDTRTKQLYAEPGPGRVRVGHVVTDDLAEEKSGAATPGSVDEKQNRELQKLARKLELQKAETASAQAAVAEAEKTTRKSRWARTA